MNENEMTTGGGWIWAFLIIALIFNGGGLFGGGYGGNVGAFTTMADVNGAINNQTTQNGIQSILLSSANNNYETAKLISDQNLMQMEANNTNLVNAIQGFNSIGLQIMNQTNVLGSKLDGLGAQMNECCCSIKTQMLQDKYESTRDKLVNAQNEAVNAQQSLYLLSQLGKYTPGSGTTGA